MTYMGKESKKECIDVSVFQIHFAVHRKIRQLCKPVTFKRMVRASQSRGPRHHRSAGGTFISGLCS